MAMKVLQKVNAKVKFLYRKIKCLAPKLKIFLYNVLVQPHFDYGYKSWFLLLSKNLKHRLHAAQNKCIRLCLGVPPRSHIGAVHPQKIIWTPVAQRVESYISTFVF